MHITLSVFERERERTEVGERDIERESERTEAFERERMRGPFIIFLIYDTQY